MANVIKGSMTTEWDCGSAKFMTSATLDLDTGKVESLEMIEDCEGLSSLDREYFTDLNGKQYEICQECHEYIVKVTMENDVTGNGLHEETHCLGHCE